MNLYTIKSYKSAETDEFVCKAGRVAGAIRNAFLARFEWATRLAAGFVVFIGMAAGAYATVSPTTATYTFTGSENGGAATDGLTVSGKATFVVSSAGTITLTLYNTTPETESTNELLTGLDFTLTYNGKTLSPALSYTSATATARTIYTAAQSKTGLLGTFTDSTTKSNIMPDWETTHSGSAYQLDFLPGKKYAIVGAPDVSTGRYGHLKTSGATSVFSSPTDPQPYDATSATFVFTDYEITNPAMLSISNVSFIYNSGCSFKLPGIPSSSTSLSPVPERNTASIFAIGIALACLLRTFSPAIRRALGVV